MEMIGTLVLMAMCGGIGYYTGRRGYEGIKEDFNRIKTFFSSKTPTPTP